MSVVKSGRVHSQWKKKMKTWRVAVRCRLWAKYRSCNWCRRK